MSIKKIGGVASARNSGLKISKGKYVTFVDSDDTIVPDGYEKAVALIEKFDVDVVCFGIEVIGDGSLERRSADNEYFRIKYNGFQKITESHLFNTDVSSCNKIFKLDLIRKYSISYQEGLIYEDALFFMKYFVAAEKAFYLKDKIYRYLRHSGSIMDQTFRGTEKSIDHIKLIECFDDYLRVNSLKYKYDFIVEKFFIPCFYFAFKYYPKEKRRDVLFYANKLVDKLNLSDRFYEIKALRQKKYDKIEGVDYITFKRLLFSVLSRAGIKEYRILGLRFRFKK